MSDPADFSWLRLVLAFSVVLALLGALNFILKYMSMRGFTLAGAPMRARRLQIVESLPVDPRRRLVIVSCDGREHLLLLSPENDIVVESNLSSPSSTPSPTASA